METPTSIMYTRAQLYKAHCQFCHASAGSLYRLLKTAYPTNTTPQTMESLEGFTRRCDPCQRISIAPLRFSFALGAEEARFNETILVDIMYIGSFPVLHIVDEATHFSAAKFLRDIFTSTIWAALIECWASIYVGIPNRIRLDAGKNFGGKFSDIAKASDIRVDSSDIEAHSSLGIGERYHHPLRSTFRKLKLDFPNAGDTKSIAMSVKAMNYSPGPEGCVPSSLVFGIYPSPNIFGRSMNPKVTLEVLARLAEAVRKEMAQEMAKTRLKRSLKHRVPPAADITYDEGDTVLVWPERHVNNRIGEWLAPFTVDLVKIHSKVVYVKDADIGPTRPFGFAQVRRYLRDEDSARNFFLK